MKSTISRMVLVVLLLQVSARALAKEPVFPVKISENKRYFVDQNDEPVFWMGTTHWNLFFKCNLEDATTTLEMIKEKGFSFVQVMILGAPNDGTKPDIFGQKPWRNHDDPLVPNEDYFKRVDDIIEAARQNNVIISLTVFHQRWRKYITEENGRQYGRLIGARYKDMPNIVWSMTPAATEAFVPVLREIAAGLREGDEGRHLITFKPDPSPASSSYVHNEPWLSFNSMQVWRYLYLIYPYITRDYNLEPTKPVLMAEGTYEDGIEYSFDITPLWIRRQAYYSYLLGAHHTYGHNDSWRVWPMWKRALDSPGARQLSLLKKTFLSLDEWWFLVPDQSILASGGQTKGMILNLAARHKDGKWAMVYLGEESSFSVNLDKITAKKVNVFWINPKTGERLEVGRFRNKEVKSFSTPDGWEDALLILKAAD